MEEKFCIQDEKALEAVIGTPMEFVKVKIQPVLDGIMAEFIARSPLIFVSTIDAGGRVDVSPKGDPAGFVRVADNGDLLIPERPGNKLTMGFRNILRNPEIGLIFVVPNQRETLRVKGRATLHNDPETLQSMAVNGSAALLYTRVRVSECFFHCGKALIRSRLWRPECWQSDGGDSIGARQFASLGAGGSSVPDDEAVTATRERLEQAYKDDLY